MDDIHNRLVRCFSLVFPSLSPEQIVTARTDSVPNWDSIAAITLVAVLQQEFSVPVDFGDLPELGSFDAVRAYLEQHNVSSHA